MKLLSRSANPPPPPPPPPLPRQLEPAALGAVQSWPEAHRAEWEAWLRTYSARIAAEGRPQAERQAEMSGASPKYILRNWMAAAAYTAAERGDFSVARELHQVLSAPYDEQGTEVAAKWAQTTPQWARGKPGLAFLS